MASPIEHQKQVLTNGKVSFWYSDIGGIPVRRAALDKDIEADVCIVGAGFTGLWTAYYLKRADPSLHIVLVEREFAGFGASGRNGGNLTGLFYWSRKEYLKVSTPDRLAAMERAVRATVDEVVAVAAQEGIDADICHAGNLAVATTPAQCTRIRDRYDDLRKNRGYGADDVALLTPAELQSRVRVEGALGAIFDRNSARVQPAKLARGLADVVERMGVRIYEGTAATAIESGRVSTPLGEVRAGIIVRATEGYTPQLPGHGREIVPLSSAILVTEPLSDEIWRQIGWSGCETVSENSYTYNYCQRTREGRITLGGRGIPYRFGSRTDVNGQTQEAYVAALLRDLKRLFPQAYSARIEQAWCGVLGVSRDWCATVGLDRQTGSAWAGGYAGAGVAMSNLAARTLRDLVLARDTELVTFPWVNMHNPTWEREPLRWLGIYAAYRLYQVADRHERLGGERPSPLAVLANRLTGAAR